MEEKELSELYLDPKSSTAFSGARRLINEAKKRKIREKQVTKWLSGQDAYTLHKKVVRKFPRRKYVLLGIDDLWQADLADVTNIARHNDGIKFWLVVIDGFSKYLWIRPLKSKHGRSVESALRSIFQTSGRKPKNFNTDNGKEFVNRNVRKLLELEGINFYTSNNPDTKASIAERVIRTIKERVYRYLTHNNNRRYLDDLDVIVAGYNNSVHRTIGMTPAEVNADTEDAVRRRLEMGSAVKRARRFRAGQDVRITRGVQPFKKGYAQSWTDEIFVVSDVQMTDPTTYKLKDYADEVITGSFYADELQPVQAKTTFKIERVLKTRKAGRESLVKWLGYPLSMASWIPTTDITKV